MTIRLVVIDDEVLVRKGVISSVDWERHGIEIAGEAPDGVSGLELIRRTKPHIVLTDIRMPHMDGLELARQVRQEAPETQIMMLSVLEDFQTVREALRIGVVDYVQKLLMTPEELLQAVLQIKQSLSAVVPTPAAPGAAAGQPAEDGLDPAAVDWLRGKDGAAVDRRVAQAGGYVVGKIYAKQSPAFMREADAAPCWPDVVQWFRRSEHEALRQAAIGAEGERTLWFVAAGSNAAPDALERGLQPLIAQSARGAAALSVGLSAGFTQAADRREAAQQAERAEQQRFFHGYGAVFRHRPRQPRAGDAPGAPADSAGAALPFMQPQPLADYVAKLRHEAEEQADAAFDRLFPRELRPELAADEEDVPRAGMPLSELSQTVVREGVYHWISRLTAHLREGDDALAGMLADYSPFAQAGSIDTYEELRAWCRRLHDIVREMLHSRYRREIHRALEYTRARYMEPLRVKEVASAVNLSENYFSYLFSRETGKTFVQVLQEIRVEQAKQLLRRPGVYWVDVTEQVGFESPKYFSKIFKKHTGATPAQFARGGAPDFGEM